MEPARQPAVSDRRGGDRVPIAAPLTITFVQPSFSGLSDNLSEGGVFFTSSERLRVVVELEIDGVKREFRGALVRVQRMSAESTGYAIEFEREVPAPLRSPPSAA
jgi:PilZ domain-containing protein